VLFFLSLSTDGSMVNVSIELERETAAAAAATMSVHVQKQQHELATSTRVSLRLIDRDSDAVLAETTTDISGTVGTAVLRPRVALRRWGPSSPEVYTLAAITSTGDALNIR
jgi:hypothetical protein